MSLVTLASLLIEETKTQIYTRGLAIATALGLRVSTWAPGDPTRSLYHYVSEVLALVEVKVAGFIRSGFLDTAEGNWLTLRASQFYKVDRIEATYAATVVRLTNTAGGYYEIGVGEVTVAHATTDKTYRNTSGGILQPGPGTYLDLDFVADEVGADSTAAAAEITVMVTSFLGVTCSNAAAALGLDEEEDEPLRDRCRAKLGMLSPDGPADAYDFVVRTPALTGDTTITRSRVVPDSTTGVITIYVAGANGIVTGGAVTLAQAAVVEWATPLCMTPTVTAATAVTINVTYEAWVYDSVGETAAAIAIQHEADLLADFQRRPIGGDVLAGVGKIYHSLIEGAIKASYPDHTFRVVVTSPAADTTLTAGQVAVLGTVTETISLVVTP